MIAPMVCAESTNLTAELSLLREQQLKALRNAALIAMNQVEATAYDERGHRIAQIYQRLAELFAAATEPQGIPSQRAVA
jgi:hypothetical protein